MYNGQNVKFLYERKGFRQIDMIMASGLKETTLLNALREGANPTAKSLEAMADALSCQIDDFFDRDKVIQAHDHIGHSVTGNGNRVSGDIALSECQREITHLKALLSEKEERLKDKEELISLYRRQLDAQSRENVEKSKMEQANM